MVLQVSCRGLPAGRLFLRSVPDTSKSGGLAIAGPGARRGPAPTRSPTNTIPTVYL